MRITKRAVDSVSLPAKGYALHWDDELKGFGLRVTSAGVKSFILQKRIHGKDHRITLGRYGEITTEQARKDAMAKAGAYCWRWRPGSG